MNNNKYFRRYSPEEELASLPRIYTKEIALKNYDIITEPSRSYNIERLLVFIDNVKKQIPNKVNITKFGIDGPPSTAILQYDGNIIRYTVDATRVMPRLEGYTTFYGHEIYSKILRRDGISSNQYFLVGTDKSDIYILDDVFKIG